MVGVRRIAPLVLIASLLLGLAACGGSSVEGKTPDACLSGPVYFRAALKAAPGQVQLPGGTLISDCLVRNQPTGDLTNVGAYLLRVATDLNAEARRTAAAAPTVQLGFLNGAVARGAADTGGVHAELQRRIEAAALYSPAGKPPPEPFDHRYEKGYAAGKDHG
jgi:hypothetical protein